METEGWWRRLGSCKASMRVQRKLGIFSARERAAILDVLGRSRDCDPRPEQADNKNACEQHKKMKRLKPVGERIAVVSVCANRSHHDHREADRSRNHCSR